MKKLWGSFAFMVVLYLVLVASGGGAMTVRNHENMAQLIGQFGMICLGAGILIISGGIDLSMGSFIGLTAVVLATGLSEAEHGEWYRGWHPAVAIGVVCGMGIVAGVIHGLLVTKLRLQAFIVTLCGLFIYRGLARWWSENTSVGLDEQRSPGFVYWFSDATVVGLPIEFIYLIVAAFLAWLLMHRAIYGRYLFAIGSNELAAKYSGIAVDRYKILAYVLCSLSAVAFAILKLTENKSILPSNGGESMELYAIAGAVLGGCSLRGGDGSVAGILIGTAILVLLRQAVYFSGVPDTLESTAIGTALLLGAILDETIRRRSAVRKV
jgi:ribose transport system permease protein